MEEGFEQKGLKADVIDGLGNGVEPMVDVVGDEVGQTTMTWYEAANLTKA